MPLIILWNYELPKQSDAEHLFWNIFCVCLSSWKKLPRRRQQNDIIVPTKPTEIHACDFSSFPQGVAYTAMNGG